MTSVYSKRELVFIISCCRCHSKINETWVRVLVSKVTPLTFNIHLSQRWAKHFGRETERRVLHGISLVGCAHMGWTHAELICQAAWTGSLLSVIAIVPDTCTRNVFGPLGWL